MPMSEHRRDLLHLLHELSDDARNEFAIHEPPAGPKNPNEPPPNNWLSLIPPLVEACQSLLEFCVESDNLMTISHPSSLNFLTRRSREFAILLTDAPGAFKSATRLASILHAFADSYRHEQCDEEPDHKHILQRALSQLPLHLAPDWQVWANILTRYLCTAHRYRQASSARQFANAVNAIALGLEDLQSFPPATPELPA